MDGISIGFIVDILVLFGGIKISVIIIFSFYANGGTIDFVLDPFLLTIFLSVALVIMTSAENL